MAKAKFNLSLFFSLCLTVPKPLPHLNSTFFLGSSRDVTMAEPHTIVKVGRRKPPTAWKGEWFDWLMTSIDDQHSSIQFRFLKEDGVM